MPKNEIWGSLPSKGWVGTKNRGSKQEMIWGKVELKRGERESGGIERRNQRKFDFGSRQISTQLSAIHNKASLLPATTWYPKPWPYYAKPWKLTWASMWKFGQMESSPDWR